MNRKRNFISIKGLTFSFLMLLFVNKVHANESTLFTHQYVNTLDSTVHQDPPTKVKMSFDPEFKGAIGLHVGTYGLGINYFLPLGSEQKFGIRAAVGFMPLKTNISGTYNNRETTSTVKANFNSAEVTLNWFPLKNQDNFSKYLTLNAGAIYLFQLEGKGTTRLKNGYQLGEITVNPEGVGEVKTTVKWDRKVNPVVGLGVSNVRLNSNLAFSANLGCAFLPSPKVSMEANGLLANNTDNTAIIEQNMKNYRYLPKLEVGISYVIK